MRRLGPLCVLLAGACAWSRPRMLVDPLKEQNELFASGKYEQLIGRLTPQAIERVQRRYRRRAYFLLAQSLARTDDLDRALSVYQFAEGLFPRDVDILSGLADLLHRIGLDERALPYYDRVLALHPSHAEANLGEAEILASQGLLPEASRHYEKALKERSFDPVLWRDYAEVLAERRDFVRAAEAIRRSLKLSRDVDSVLDLALFERRKGNREQAYGGIKDAQALAPARRDLMNREALWRLEDGEADAALALAAATLSAAPEDPLARWIRASVELRRGQLEAAESDLALAATQTKQPFIARTASAMLHQLRGDLTR